MVTANNYMFRLLTGHHQVVNPPKPFSFGVQHDNVLLEAKTFSC